MAKFIIYFFCVSLAVVLLAGGLTSVLMLEGTPPEIKPISVPKIMGKQSNVIFSFHDKGRGVREIKAFLIQGEKIVTLPGRVFPAKSWWKGTGIKDKTVSWRVNPLSLGLSQGKTILRITARDASWRNDFKGNERIWQSEIVVDTIPPAITVLSLFHNLSTGGSGLISYKTNKDVSRTGVWVNDIFFPGYPRPEGGPGEYVALIAIPFDAIQPKLYIEAVDLAGNVARAGFPHEILYRKPSVHRIEITDGFLAQKLPEFTARYPELSGTPTEIFLQINTKLRAKNDKEIRGICLNTSREILWHGPFMALSGTKEAGFADERHYFYKGKEISQANHMGIDIAALVHSPVPASNSGRVIFTGYIGIYGNAIIIDHGLGLASLYGHLNEIKVHVGDAVERGAVIGLTDSTGLAGGDHLHYSMLVHGVFVNPTEWWDGKWIKDHITDNLLAQ